MSLLSQYNDATNGEFRQKILMAFSKTAATKIQAIEEAWSGTPSIKDPRYDIYISFMQQLLQTEPSGVTFIARVLAANNVNNSSQESTIQAAIDNNFDALALLFDPDVGA